MKKTQQISWRGTICSLTSPPKTCHFQLQQPSTVKWIYANTFNQCSNVEANWVMLAKPGQLVQEWHTVSRCEKTELQPLVSSPSTK